MNYDDLKCEKCRGSGELERNIEGADVMCICSWCEGTGITENLIGEIDKLLSLLEGSAHGSEGQRITEMRKFLNS